MTLRLELIIIFMLQSGGISEKFEYLFKEVGEDVLLPCDVDRSSNQCSDMKWLYGRRVFSRSKILTNENDVQSSAGASRLSVNSNYSLTIRNITDKDVGQYVCRCGDLSNLDTVRYLNILSVSSFPSDVNGRVNLTCSLKSYDEPDACRRGRIVWVDEARTELSGKNAEFETVRQKNCVSVVTVKHQSEKKRFTCQFVRNKKTAVYSLTDISGQTERLYHRVGEDVILPCRAKSSSSSCSDVTWMYQKDPNAAFKLKVHNKTVLQSPYGASRLSVSSNCSLLIRNITEEDAGLYVCREKHDSDTNVYLNTLSTSKEVQPRGYGDITLLCSLNRYNKRIPCKENSIIWRDERGSHLTGEGVWFEFRGQTNCVSVLTVKHQSGNNKRFTCQFIEDNKVKIDAVYVLDISDLPGHNFILMVGSVVKVVLMFLGLVAALIYMYRRRTKENEEQRTRTRGTFYDDDEDVM